MTARDDIFQAILEAYGNPGLHAYESTCLTDEDIAKGYDHCVERIAPALEEEMMAEQCEVAEAADLGFDLKTPTIHGTARRSIPKSWHGEGRNFID